MADATTGSEGTYATALQYASKGIYVNPVYVRRKEDGKKDVRPVGLWRDTSTTDGAKILAWERAHPDAGLLIDCGKSRLVVVDCDGEEGMANWRALFDDGEPLTPLGLVRTSSGGEHWYYRAHPDHPIGNDQSGKVAPGVDIRGLGGFVFAPPTADGMGTWEWESRPAWDAHWLTVPHIVIERMKLRPGQALNGDGSTFGAAPVADPALLEDARNERAFTDQEARDFIQRALDELKKVRSGYNGAINNFALTCAHFPWKVDRELCGRLVIKALGPHTGWTAPDADDIRTINSAYSAIEGGTARDPWVAVRVEKSAAPAANGSRPQLNITSTADMTYWLAENAGAGRLAGLFARDGRVVHTPRVAEDGYVPAPKGADNGPAEIQPVSADELAAKLQFLYGCFKNVKNTETGAWEEKAALFPVDAARRVVNAPEAAARLRPLKGITLTPMVRADGSILAEPGYDTVSGYLFLPGPGVDVSPVDGQGLGAARDLLLHMVEGFPFAGDDDRANYLGALLTPMLRLVTPPPYKMIGIGAHQPGSGKSLLAETISLIHGGVLRSEVPEDEAEWRKMTTSLLATTSAPVAVLDNVTGVLRSSTLAGLLTARGEIQDRELGSSKMIRTENDRLWVVTGNNLSLGGDLVRRTITVMIDPDMANPETRTGFAIQDLPGWVTEHRNELLHALLTLIKNWVDLGRPLEDRAQSDGYASWEKAVGGILAAAGVLGRFDAESGKRAATGGDDDGLLAVLERIHQVHGAASWTVSEALSPPPGQMIEESREWLPSVILEKLARSEPGGRKSLGRWLLNRRGRWVTAPDGAAYVLRQGEQARNGVATWRVETR